MNGDLALRCACGTLRGTLRHPPGERATRVVCYCDDCRAFARWLDVDAPALDQDGGSDIVQVSPARLSFTRGADRLACVRLSPDGLTRWYADCCRAPVCNAPAPIQLPFAGVSAHLFFHAKGDARLDRAIGPVTHGVHAGRGHAVEAPWPVHPGIPLSLLLASVRNVGGWRLRGDHRRSPLTDAATGDPVATPTVLSAEEHAALRAGPSNG